MIRGNTASIGTPAKEWDSETVEEIADVLDAADLKPQDFMPVDVAAQLAPATVIDANELLWAARILAGLVRVHRSVIPDMREKVKLARAILESYAGVPAFDPCNTRWTIAFVNPLAPAAAVGRLMGVTAPPRTAHPRRRLCPMARRLASPALRRAFCLPYAA
jgi:hypothetical protein